MASQTQFDLNKEVGLWRENLWLSGNFSSDELDELESHLRDELGCASFAPLHDEEKFVLAKHKIGSEKTLIKAYSSKRHLNFNRISWIYQACMAAVAFLMISKISFFLSWEIQKQFWLSDPIMRFFSHWGMQLIGAFLLWHLFKRLVKLSKTEQSIYRANTMAIIGFLLIVTVFLALKKHYDLILMDSASLVIYSIPYFLFTLLFLTFVVTNFRLWQKAKKAGS